ncbi:MAG: hypothetical protein LC776_07720, partial [Acidobacteria bacterium]|nr:hypothetical protein [Acidobacteriota bacterium]
IQIAEQTGDLTLIGSAARRVAHALSTTHQSIDAVHLVKSAANRLEPHLSNANPAFISAYGMLLLKGSIAAARLQQAADARDLQDEALAVATRLGADRNEHWSAFGATNVLVHRVSALADMQSGGRVIEMAKKYQLAIFCTCHVSAGLITCLMCLVVICKLVNAMRPLARSWMPTSLPAKKCAAVLSHGRLLPIWYAATHVA